MSDNRKKAIIIGATSGIGRALTDLLITQNYTVAVTGRRLELLEEIRQQHGSSVTCCPMDVNDPEAAIAAFNKLAAEPGNIDLVIISAGTGTINKELAWEPELLTINTNVTGFVAIATAAMRFFLKQGSGHLVGISSVAALRGAADAPAYNASKAFVTNYMEGLHVKAKKSGMPIWVTDVMPGFVDTHMAQGEGLFWVAPPAKAAQQIYEAIQAKKRQVYITRRWRLIGWLMKILPDFLYRRL